MNYLSWNEGVALLSRTLGAPLSKPQLRAFAEYVRGYQLLLAGKAGTGKTSFFKALIAAKFSGADIYNIVKESKQSIDWVLQDMDFYKNRELVIDDIGRESPKIEYGERTEVLDLIMSYREEHCSHVRTHYVTNLTLEELGARYGERVVSRLHYCQPIAFLDEDKRRAKRFNVCPFNTCDVPAITSNKDTTEKGEFLEEPLS